MAPSWQEMAVQHVEKITGYVRGSLSTGLVYLKSELGIDLGLNPDACAPWLVLLSAVFGLVIMLGLCVSVFRSFPKGISATKTRKPTQNTSPRAVVKEKVISDEPKKRNRRRNTDKKAQRNGLPAEPQEESNVVDEQEKKEVKVDKEKKNKKKMKTVQKEKNVSPSTGKEPDEGSWETKVSSREKRQQKRKDCEAPGDGSNTPVLSAAAVSSASGAQIQTQSPPEDLPSSAIALLPREAKVEAPDIEKCITQDPVVPQVTSCWQEELAGDGSGWSEVVPRVSSPHGESWSSMTLPAEHRASESSVWPQDMEGSWTIVDKSQIPLSLCGLTGDLNWSAQPAVPEDDEWAGMSRGAADPSGDWDAPAEEWGNYVDQRQVSAEPLDLPVPDRTQDSDYQKEIEEAGAPGSGKAKKKKKKNKKKGEDCGASSPGKEEVTVTPAKTICSGAAGSSAESAPCVSSSAPVLMQPGIDVPEQTNKSNPTQKTYEGTPESVKPVKKKKARRET